MSEFEIPGVVNVYCANCDAPKPYSIKFHRVKQALHGTTFSYRELVAYCSDCGREVSTPEVTHLNSIIREEEYNAHANALYHRCVYCRPKPKKSPKSCNLFLDKKV